MPKRTKAKNKVTKLTIHVYSSELWALRTLLRASKREYMDLYSKDPDHGNAIAKLHKLATKLCVRATGEFKKRATVVCSEKQ